MKYGVWLAALFMMNVCRADQFDPPCLQQLLGTYDVTAHECIEGNWDPGDTCWGAQIDYVKFSPDQPHTVNPWSYDWLMGSDRFGTHFDTSGVSEYENNDMRAWSEHTATTCAFYAQNEEYRRGQGFEFSNGHDGTWDFTVYGNKGPLKTGLIPKFVLHLKRR